MLVFNRCCRNRAVCFRRDTDGETRMVQPGWSCSSEISHMHHSIGQKLFCVHDTYNSLKPGLYQRLLIDLSAKLVFAIVLSQVLDYDYYGAYDVPENTDYKYSEILGKEYTFDFPPHHDVVSMCV